MVSLVFWSFLLMAWRWGAIGTHGAITAILAWNVACTLVRFVAHHMSITGEEVQ